MPPVGSDELAAAVNYPDPPRRSRINPDVVTHKKQDTRAGAEMSTY